MKAEKLLNLINESIIQPDSKVVDAVVKATKSVSKEFNSNDWDEDQLADKLYEKIKVAGKKFKIDIEMTHKYDALEGCCGDKGDIKNGFWLDIFCDKTYTYKMWETNRFEEWLVSIKKVISHELVHIEQMKRILEVKPTEFTGIIDRIILSYSREDSKTGALKIKDFDKYLYNCLELMAYAKSTWDEIKEVYDKENALELLKRSKGWGKLMDCSKVFGKFYEYQDKFPKLFKKYLRYLSDYIKKG